MEAASSGGSGTRGAACLACRRSKIKCNWDLGHQRCRRCMRLEIECVRSTYQPGRQKGIKNKRRGLDKAFYQIDQAIKRVRAGTEASTEEQSILDQLRDLVNDNAASTGSHRSHAVADGEVDYDSNDQSDEELPDTSPSVHSLRHPIVSSGTDSLAVDDAENPLQLLARASYLQPSPDSRQGRSPQTTRTPQNTSKQAQSENTSDDLYAFFAPARALLDVGDDIDPVSLGLVSEDEATALFDFFHQNLAHTRWGLSPRLYTAEFTRSRSAFLSTSIMASSALFLPADAALSKRLSLHAEKLAHRVINGRYKSVEIVLAFLVNIPWMFPGKQSTDDESCTYMAMASKIAMDLSLEKQVIHGDVNLQSVRESLHRADTLDPRSALDIDGFPDMDPSSEIGHLLLRNRERCWIALFVLERGMSLARGRPFSVPITRVLRECDDWHKSSAASDPQDGAMTSIAVLRRDLDGLFVTVRTLCDSSPDASDGALVAQSIQGAIDQFFGQWFTVWGNAIRQQDGRLPPYVEILVSHTRLSIYGGVINHPTAPLEVRRLFHAAGLSSALSVMRVAIQGESQLQSMPNNTSIMISFAACFALALSAHAAGDSVLAPSVRNLIEEAATVLIRIGRVTKHRNGLSVLYGQYLAQILKRTDSNTESTKANGYSAPTPAMEMSYAQPSFVTDSRLATEQQQQHQNTLPQSDENNLWPEMFHFSTMSDAQIQQVLNQPGNDLEASFGGLSGEDMTNFDWLYWPDIGI
ncbi:Zn(II)2Cys6 transcription factor [Sarocladium implicatum]|nr:Zn(II)2Cys6 transcription factor [Sarocladium implicatum]